MKKSKKTVLRTQLLRRRQVEVVHADLVVGVDVGPVVEGLGPNVDEEVVEEDREDDLEQVMLMTTARTMKLAKSVLEVVARCCRQGRRDLVEEGRDEEVGQKMMICRCGWGGVVDDGQQRAPGDPGSATMLNPEGSDGCSGRGCSEVIGVVTSSLSVHAWSLVAMVGSVMIATIVVVVLLPLMLAPPFDDASLSQEAVQCVVC